MGVWDWDRNGQGVRGWGAGGGGVEGGGESYSLGRLGSIPQPLDSETES